MRVLAVGGERVTARCGRSISVLRRHAEIVSHEWPMQDTKGHFGLSNVRVCEGRLPSRVVCQAHAIMVDRKPVRTKICLIFMPPSSLDRLLQDSR